VGVLADLLSNESPSECAGSVLMISVRFPDPAARTAVAAATVVFPDAAAFPVNSRTRIPPAARAPRRRVRRPGLAELDAPLQALERVLDHALLALRADEAAGGQDPRSTARR
jgi:hypothetical protein